MSSASVPASAHVVTSVPAHVAPIIRVQTPLQLLTANKVLTKAELKKKYLQDLLKNDNYVETANDILNTIKSLAQKGVTSYVRSIGDTSGANPIATILKSYLPDSVITVDLDARKFTVDWS